MKYFLHESHIRFVPHRATLSSSVADHAGFPAAHEVVAGGEEAPVPHPTQVIQNGVFSSIVILNYFPTFDGETEKVLNTVLLYLA